MRVVLVVVFLLLTIATFDVAGRHLVGGHGNNIWSYIWRNANDVKKLKTSMENSMAKMKTTMENYMAKMKTSIENLQKVIGSPPENLLKACCRQTNGRFGKK